MAMYKSGNSVGRLLPLLAIIALLPFSILSCTKAGDEPEGPTGPGSTYNPEMDTPGAKIVVHVEHDVIPGDMFWLTAAFTDGDGRPVPGVPLTVQAETGTGAVVGYFSYEANPNVTDEQGRISTHVTVAADCPIGSYTFVVYSTPGGVGPVNGPHARGFAGIYVGSSGVAPVLSLVSLATSTPVVTVGGSANFSIVVTKSTSCTLRLTCDAVGAGLTVNDADCFEGLNSYMVTTAGTLDVQATGRCTQTPSAPPVLSAVVSVTVNVP